MSNYIEYNNKIIFHPGYYLEELFNESYLTQEDFAEDLGITIDEMNNIINGDGNITEKIAIKLSRKSMTTPDVWLNLQRKYDEQLAEIQSTVEDYPMVSAVREEKKEKTYNPMVPVEKIKVIKIIRVFDDMGKDEYHEIYDIGLKDGALFHRFKTHNGYEYSAIYQANKERLRCDPSEEEEMISKWNASLYN